MAMTAYMAPFVIVDQFCQLHGNSRTAGHDAFALDVLPQGANQGGEDDAGVGIEAFVFDQDAGPQKMGGDLRQAARLAVGFCVRKECTQGRAVPVIISSRI